jgi:hypothetical protein
VPHSAFRASDARAVTGSCIDYNESGVMDSRELTDKLTAPRHLSQVPTCLPGYSQSLRHKIWNHALRQLPLH